MGVVRKKGPSEQLGNWRNRAMCADQDPELFFPLGTGASADAQAAEAAAVCARCPVAIDCGMWALNTGQDAGVWGGLSEVERREILRRGWCGLTQDERCRFLRRYRQRRLAAVA